jgi:Lrp/AsnC family transcriptional regulator, leucine-responsive regulatory protein
MAGELDEFDIKILQILARNGRITWTELADGIGLSLTPTLKRVRRLEANGYIAGYQATIDETRVGRAISVFISVSLSTQTDAALARFESSIRDIPEIMSCFMMTGETDYALRIVVPDLTAYRAFISVLTQISGVSRVTSSFAVKAVIQRSAPPLPARIKKPLMKSRKFEAGPMKR